MLNYVIKIFSSESRLLIFLYINIVDHKRSFSLYRTPGPAWSLAMHLAHPLGREKSNAQAVSLPVLNLQLKKKKFTMATCSQLWYVDGLKCARLCWPFITLIREIHVRHRDYRMQIIVVIRKKLFSDKKSRFAFLFLSILNSSWFLYSPHQDYGFHNHRCHCCHIILISFVVIWFVISKSYILKNTLIICMHQVSIK